MKIKISKENGIYIVETDKEFFTIALTSQSKKLVITIEEKSKNGISKENYVTKMTISQLYQLSAVFKIFESVNEALEGIKTQLDLQLFSVKKTETGIILSLYVFGKAIAFLLNKADEAKENSEGEEEDSLDDTGFDVSNCKLVKIIETNNTPHSNLILLQDGRFGVGAFSEILLYNSETFEHELTLKGHSSWVYYISQIDSGELISSSVDKTIKIWKISKDSYTILKTLVGHSGFLYQAIGLSNQRIGSCSFDKTIKIWDKNNDYNCIKTLAYHSESVYSIIETKDKKYIVSAGADKKIAFWNDSKYNCEKVISNISCIEGDSMMETNEKKLIVAGKNEISIIDLSLFQLEKKISCFEGFGSSLIQLKKGVVLCGLNTKDILSLTTFDIKNYEILNMKPYAHDSCKENENYICGLLKINKSTIASLSSDWKIKIWKSS